MTRLPLEGIRVLELGNYMAGPYAGTLLGDMGADVVKIEAPGEGDYSRGLGPFPPGSKDGASFLRLNRNKRSLVLDLKRDGGKRALLALVRRADVVIENFRTGTMDSLGVGYDALAKERPDLVYLSVTGFGRTGPYRDRPGLDLILQAETGVMSATGEEGRPPVKVGVPIIDMATAIYGAYAVVAALRVRDRDGVGQLIDLSLLESGVSLAIWESGVYLTTGEIPGRLGSAHRLTAPYEAFRTLDGHIAIGATTPPTWSAFCRVMGLEDLAADPRLGSGSKRFAHRRELAERIEKVTATRTTAEWFRALREAGVPCGRINTYADVFADPHLAERGIFVDLPDPGLGKLRSIGSPLHLSKTPPRLERTGPRLGEHSREVLAEAGLGASEIDALFAAGVTA
jgi:formyl-CoA transferase